VRHYHLFAIQRVLETLTHLQASGLLVMWSPLSKTETGPARSGLLRTAQRLLPPVKRFFALPGVDPAVGRLHRAFRILYSPPAQLFLLVMGLFGVAVFAWRLLSGGTSPTRSAGPLATVVATVISYALLIVCHELAHALTCKHFGRLVPRAGVGWLFFIPIAFVDVSDMWLAPRPQRIAVTAAGPYVNFLQASAAVLASLLVADPRWRHSLLLFASLGYSLALLNLNPLLELDGYFILMDWLEIPNLRARALAYLGSLVAGAPKRRYPARERAILIVFGALALGYTVIVIVILARLYHDNLEHAAAQVVPATTASAAGWVLVAIFTGLVLRRVWGELHGSGIR